jgi:hypothetical protein
MITSACGGLGPAVDVTKSTTGTPSQAGSLSLRGVTVIVNFKLKLKARGACDDSDLRPHC